MILKNWENHEMEQIGIVTLPQVTIYTGLTFEGFKMLHTIELAQQRTIETMAMGPGY